MKAIPYLIRDDSSGEKLIPIDRSAPIFNEAWLQELLRVHPDILPVADIEPVFSPLVPIGLEVTTTRGNIDNLFISLHGYPVLVETKLWRNPDAKREVLAQSIDYAASISAWKYQDIDNVTRKYTAKHEDKVFGLIDWIEHYTHEQIDDDPVFFEETISRNLRLGRFLVLVVGDRIRSSMVEMMDYINQYPHLAINVVLIELQCFRMSEEAEWPLVVVPSIHARTEIVERSIVQVEVSLDGESKVTAKQEKIGEDRDSKRSPLSEDDYWEHLRHQDPDALAMTQKLINHFRKKAGIVIKPRENSIAVHFYLPESGQRITLFFIRTDGVIECWHASISEQFSKGGLSKELKNNFFQEVKLILRKHTPKLSYYYPVKKVDINAFIEAYERFMDSLLQVDTEIN